MPQATEYAPKPISDSMQKHLNEVLAKIPSQKTGTVRLGLSTTGVALATGVRWSRPWGDLSLAATAGRDWTKGWVAGGEVVLDW